MGMWVKILQDDCYGDVQIDGPAGIVERGGAIPGAVLYLAGDKRADVRGCEGDSMYKDLCGRHQALKGPGFCWIH